MRVAVLAVVAACSSPAPVHSVDAGVPPLDFTLYVGFDSTRTDMPQVFIDGAATTTVHRVYPDFTSPILHTIELRYADHVLASESVRDEPGDCGPATPGLEFTTIREDFSALASGDLRYYGDEWVGENPTDGTNTICNGDGFGIADCFCPSTQRCVPRVTLADPLFTRMACAPIGPKAAGDSCTLTPDPAGAYDDCGSNLLCYQGTCHALCNGANNCATTCVQPEGYPPEAIFCM